MKYCFLLLFVLSYSIIAQNLSLNKIELPKGLSLSNQLEFAYDTERELQIMENWLNLDYRYGIFSAGFRFDAYQPNDPDPSINRGKLRYADIAYKYIQADIGNSKAGMKITVGNYYTLFGRGMILKSYEDRNIRIDNNLSGVKVVGNYADFKLKLLTGMAENAKAERTEILSAADLEYSGIKNLKFGTSFATNNPDNNSANTSLASIRIMPRIWNFDFYGEYGVKLNDDIKSNAFNDQEWRVGEAYYGGVNFFYDGFSLSGEYKYYDNFGFETSDGTILYNTPPATRKDYSYILLNRHPSPLNQQNEKGFQVEANYYFSYETYLTANYGLTQTLDKTSFYQRSFNLNLPVQTQFEEVYFQLGHTWSSSLESIAAFGYSEELSSNTKNITPILETRYYPNEFNTIRLILEHQQTEDKFTSEKYFDDVVTLEYLRSPNLSITLVTEMKTTEPSPGKTVRKFWNFVQFGYKIGNHTDLSLLIGSRQAGNICISGVCRYEPEFKGVELKMLTRLY